MNRKITGIHVDVKGRSISIKTIEDKLCEFYNLIDCSCIDIVTRKIGDRQYDIVCDDEGLLKDRPIVSAVDRSGNPTLVGNLFICGVTDSDGNLTSIDKSDYNHVVDNMRMMLPTMTPVVANMEY